MPSEIEIESTDPERVPGEVLLRLLQGTQQLVLLVGAAKRTVPSTRGSVRQRSYGQGINCGLDRHAWEASSSQSRS